MKHALLCTEQGIPQGTSNVDYAHAAPGKLHRAFSIFIFRNNYTELLIQKRTDGKRFGGLWANTCCSHLQENEDLIAAAEKRLKEECGFTCPLTEHSSFIYRANDPTGDAVEYEFDSILIGDFTNPNLNPDPTEISELKWINIDKLTNEIENNPEKFAPWLPIALDRILSIEI
ncbi:isopentenyl-diphosphate Delta-isomerase [Patescibacteria group bacterium]|nr:isopentenyl-diphosphate Delta-isomerase [Patescibacteria group bacterium]MBU1123538.1 isopentenyl-diphosphate Delta-isomerase [Patescibacteria group bacterium]MBU1911561.1 isopentenyl-diphosphate Delta-isomerase [Patescibacteria group bacterium]